MASLFDNGANRIDFGDDTVLKGTYDEGSQYRALGGDDVVRLPWSSAGVLSSGYDRSQTFYAGDGNDWVAVSDLGDSGGYNQGYALDGGRGDDHLSGGPSHGPNEYTGGPGDDYIEDGGRISVFHYSGRSSNYKVTYGIDLTGRTIVAVHALKGSDGVDTIKATAGTLQFADRAVQFGPHHYGSSTARTAGLKAAAANAHGGDASDRLSGVNGNDVMSGNGGNDVLFGKFGNDKIHGNAGQDFIYGDAHTSVNAKTGGNDFLYGDAGPDALYGEGGNDKLFGGTDHDILYGGNGNDQLSGGANDDLLQGGLGTDTMTGGPGWDTFAWVSVKETSTKVSKADLVRDFGAGDKLDFHAIDADISKAGYQTFTFIGSTGFTEPGQIRAVQSGGETRILLNVDGNPDIDAIIRVAGLHDVKADWFVV